MKIFNGFEELTLSKKGSFLDKTGVFDPPFLSLELFQKTLEIVKKRLWHIVILKKTLLSQTVFTNFRSKPGAQPEIFQSRGGSVGLLHFDKHFIRNTEKGPIGNNFGVFF